MAAVESSPGIDSLPLHRKIVVERRGLQLYLAVSTLAEEVSFVLLPR